MGSFFTNVQLRRGPEVTHEGIVEVLDVLARGVGMARCQSDQGADRTVVIRAGAGDWISIYDEDTEGQDTAKLERLAAALSARTKSSAFTVLVHDSDVLQLGLFVRGKKLDQVDSNPGYFTGRRPTKKALQRAAGKPERWKPLLAPEIRPEALTDVWTEERLFAEDTLARTAALLACPMERAGVGFRYLEQDSIPSEELFILRYALLERPPYEADADGPPRFLTDLPPEYAMVPAAHALAVGDELRVAVTCRNAGGPGTGVGIVVWGSAIDSGLVQPERFELLVGNVMAGAKHVMLCPEVRDSASGRLWMIDETRPIPAGIKGGLAALAGAGDASAVFDAMHRSQVHVNVIGEVVAHGAGRLHVALFPLELGTDGAFVAVHDLAVDLPLYRPLHARDSNLDGSLVVRPLSQRDVLIAMVVYGVGQARAAEHAASVFERFAKACPPLDRYEKAVFHADPSRRPKTGTLRTKGLFGSKRWKDIVSSFESDRQVMLAPPFDTREFDPAQGQLTRHGHGIAFGRAILPPPGMERDSETPVLLLWARIDELDESHVAKLRSLALGIVGEAMTDYDGIQGIVTRWGQEGSPDSTAYEQACGIHGPLTMLESWSTRWLRAVGNDTLWLGRDLKARLDPESIAALGELAEVDRVGPGLRIVLRHSDDTAVSKLEERLQSLLPSGEQAHEAQMLLCRRSEGD